MKRSWIPMHYDPVEDIWKISKDVRSRRLRAGMTFDLNVGDKLYLPCCLKHSKNQWYILVGKRQVPMNLRNTSKYYIRL